MTSPCTRKATEAHRGHPLQLTTLATSILLPVTSILSLPFYGLLPFYNILSHECAIYVGEYKVITELYILHHIAAHDIIFCDEEKKKGWKNNLSFYMHNAQMDSHSWSGVTSTLVLAPWNQFFQKVPKQCLIDTAQVEIHFKWCKVASVACCNHTGCWIKTVLLKHLHDTLKLHSNIIPILYCAIYSLWLLSFHLEC